VLGVRGGKPTRTGSYVRFDGLALLVEWRQWKPGDKWVEEVV